MSGHRSWKDLRYRNRKVDPRPGWAATIECARSIDDVVEAFDEKLDDLVEALAPAGGAVSGSTAHDRYGATFSIYTTIESVPEVVDRALLAFHEAAAKADLPPWSVVRCEVMTFAEQDAAIDRG